MTWQCNVQSSLAVQGTSGEAGEAWEELKDVETPVSGLQTASSSEGPRLQEEVNLDDSPYLPDLCLSEDCAASGWTYGGT